MSTINFALRGKNIAELRGLAKKYLDLPWLDIERLDRTYIVSQLSVISEKETSLAKELRKSAISMKPSFYLMMMAPLGEVDISKRKDAINEYFAGRDKKSFKENEVPTYQKFHLDEVAWDSAKGVAEFHFSWSHAQWFWMAPNVSFEHILEFRYGFAVLNFKAKKAIVACHTEQEKNIISNALSDSLPIKLTSLKLTQPILHQIGSFDHVKRASYFVEEDDANIPQNISYADERLSIKTAARFEEESKRSTRKQSFYLIPLGTIVQQGVGATSDSGKLWIPRELPIETVRDYSIQLLRKIDTTLNKLTQNQKYSEVIESLGTSTLDKLSGIKSSDLRSEIYHLVEELVNMLLLNESVRPFEVSDKLVSLGIPKLFNYPRFQVVDSETGEAAWLKDENNIYQLIELVQDDKAIKFYNIYNKKQIELDKITHPITGNKVDVKNGFENLQLIPTTDLHAIVSEMILHLSHQIEKLGGITFTPFSLVGGQIYLDVDRVKGKIKSTSIGTTVYVSDIKNFKKVAGTVVLDAKKDRIHSTLNRLGEKCVYESDDNCSTCLSDTKYICLRSLLGRFIDEPLIFKHKGIELSDIQGKIILGGDTLRVFGFAKLASSTSSLTARNEGSTLISQVLGQLDKTGFDVVMIISPSTINEDLRDRLQIICAWAGKKLLILDKHELSKFLVAFEESSAFDEIDVNKLYNISKPRKTKK